MGIDELLNEKRNDILRIVAKHGAANVRIFGSVAQGAARRLTLKTLPSYAPDLNPEEVIWRFLKYVELKNVCCHHLAELRLEVRRAIERLRFKVDVILGCIRQLDEMVQRSRQTQVAFKGSLNRSRTFHGRNLGVLYTC